MPTTRREKMQRFVPLLMSLMNIATSRTEPIDSPALGLSDSIGKHYWNEMFPKSDEISIVPGNRLQSQAVEQHYYEMDENDNIRASNKQETKFITDPLTTRKINALDNIHDDAFEDFDESTDSMNEPTENDLNDMSTFLTTLLHRSTWKAPLVIVNEPPFSMEPMENELESLDKPELRPNGSKRSRYYRRYPYKRQNPRYQNGYDYDAAYFCMPSRDDIFHLLGALHDLRQGDKSRHVHFCNRRRTARTLLTHVRFLGRRK